MHAVPREASVVTLILHKSPLGQQATIVSQMSMRVEDTQQPKHILLQHGIKISDEMK